jgi:hypothetical protein
LALENEVKGQEVRTRNSTEVFVKSRTLSLSLCQGKVRFFGGNLKATHDFGKKAANVAGENLSVVAGRYSHPTHP